MPKKKTKLKNLIIDRVDLVDRGDNPEAHINLFKRKDSEPYDFIRRGGEDDIEDTVVDNFIEKLYNRIKKGDDEKMPKALEEFLKGLESSQKDALEAPLKKAAENMEEEELKNLLDLMKGDLHKGEDNDYDAEKLKEENEKLKQQIKELKEGTNKGEGDDDDDMQKYLKSLPEDVRKKIEDTEKLAKQLQEEREEQKFADMAKQLTNLPAKDEEIIPVLKSIKSDGEEDNVEKLISILKAADEAVERANVIQKQLGQDGDGQQGSDAWSKIESKAEECMKSNPDLTKEQAIKNIIKQDPSLYKEYQKELKEV